MPERPTGRSGPQGGTDRRPGIRASGFEGEGANQRAVSRPEQSGGRVTATEKKMIARGSLSPTKEESGCCRRTLFMIHVFADERSVRRTRSHPCKSPRTGSRSEATSAGTGQNKGGFSRRCRGSPSGADGRGCQAAGGAERSPAPTDDGDRKGGRGNTRVAAVHKAGEERRFGATPATATLPPSS